MLFEQTPERITKQKDKQRPRVELKWNWKYAKLELADKNTFFKGSSFNDQLLPDKKNKKIAKLQNSTMADDSASLSTMHSLSQVEANNSVQELDWVQEEVTGFFQRQFFLRNEVFKGAKAAETHQEYVDSLSCCWKALLGRNVARRERVLRERVEALKEELLKRVHLFESKVEAVEANFIKRTIGLERGTAVQESFDRILPRSLTEDVNVQREFKAIFEGYTLTTEVAEPKQEEPGNCFFEFSIFIQKTAPPQTHYMTPTQEEYSYLMASPVNHDFTFDGSAYKITLNSPGASELKKQEPSNLDLFSFSSS
jgi:hypothetical protein